MKLPSQPTIYEINTAVFVSELRQRLRRNITLANVPAKEWDRLASLHIDAVWFMGIWQRSPMAQNLAHLDPNLRKTLPSLREEDILGSAYSVHRYVVDDFFGGPKALAEARIQLAKRGIGLILDYVPNHVALDHPWTNDRPDHFILGQPKDLKLNSNAFAARPAGILAKGKDPNYEPWSDVAQLHAFSPTLRQETIETLTSISDQCDGVRCDMAMLMMNEVFGQTWGKLAGRRPKEDFWPPIITAIRKHSPEFVFIAEVYWGFGQKLLQQGFNFCYDKDLYDSLVHGPTKSIQALLRQPHELQRHSLRFIENHDEPRAAAIFHRARHEASAVILATTMGAKLYHQGQLDGMQIKLPVHLARKPHETTDEKLHEFYMSLLSRVQKMGTVADWRLCSFKSWAGLPSSQVMCWYAFANTNSYVVIVNYSREAAKGRLALPQDITNRYGETVLSSKRRHLDEAKLLQGQRVVLAPWEFSIIRLD